MYVHAASSNQQLEMSYYRGEPVTLAFTHVHFLARIPSTRVQVHGSSAGGDADELRLLSTSNTFINLRAHGGSLDFLSTKVGFAFRISH